MGECPHWEGWRLCARLREQEHQEPQAREKCSLTLTSHAGLKLLSISSSNKRVLMGQLGEGKLICLALSCLTA